MTQSSKKMEESFVHENWKIFETANYKPQNNNNLKV